MRFCITFGQKYRREPHPHGGHPDGWFEVEADSRDEACRKTFKALGTQWAFIYAYQEFTKSFFPLGKIGEIP